MHVKHLNGIREITIIKHHVAKMEVWSFLQLQDMTKFKQFLQVQHNFTHQHVLKRCHCFRAVYWVIALESLIEIWVCSFKISLICCMEYTCKKKVKTFSRLLHVFYLILLVFHFHKKILKNQNKNDLSFTKYLSQAKL